MFAPFYLYYVADLNLKCQRCVNYPKGCFGPAYFEDGSLGSSLKCHKCLVAKQRCDGGSVEIPEVIEVDVDVVVPGKRKVKPTPKVAVSEAKSKTPPIVVVPTLRKRDAVEPPSDGPLAKVARKSFTPVIPRREVSQSSGYSLQAPVTTPSTLFNPISPFDPLMMRLDSLATNIRQSHEENVRRMEFANSENMRRIAELRDLIAEERARNAK